MAQIKNVHRVSELEFVTRCKNCKHRKSKYSSIGILGCKLLKKRVHPDFYCARGDRGGDNGDNDDNGDDESDESDVLLSFFNEPIMKLGRKGEDMVKAHDGQIVHNTLIDALVSQEIQRMNEARAKEDAQHEKEIAQRIAELETRLYFAKRSNRRLVTNQLEEARRNYKPPKKPGLLKGIALVAASYIVLAFARLTDVLGM